MLNTQTIGAILVVLHWLLITTLCLRVIMKRPPIGVSLAWLMVIASVPYAGAALYLFVGERRLGRHRATKINANIAMLQEWQSRLPNMISQDPSPSGDPFQSITKLARKVLGYPVQSGNRIQLFDDPDDTFRAIIDDIDQAHKTCDVLFYIWEQIGKADLVYDAMIRASMRGVRCRAIADAIGSRAFLSSPDAYRLRSAGVELVAALPTGIIRTLLSRRDLRNHRKLIVIDDRIAYTGSQNLADPKFFKRNSAAGEWIDAFVRITGPAVLPLSAVFAMDWAVETATTCKLPDLNADPSTLPAAQPEDIPIQVVPSGPDHHSGTIHQVLLTAIYSAQQRIVLTTPYFVPDDALLTALSAAALRGVEVTLIVPAHVDSKLARFASAANFHDLMRDGVRIARFQNGLLHTKSFTIDDSVSIFGTANLDMRSLWLNFELSLLICDPDFTATLRTLQDTYIQHSVIMDSKVWSQRSLGRVFLENAARLVGPLL